MARTRASGKATGAKAMKKSGGSAIPKAPARKSGKKKYGGGNSYVPRSTPSWQKQITRFVTDPLKYKKPVPSAAAGSTKDLENRSFDDDANGVAIPGSSTQISGPISSVHKEENGNSELEMDARSSDEGGIAIPGSSGHNEKNGNDEVKMYAKLFGESGVAVSGSPNLLPVPVSLAQWEVDHEEEVWSSDEGGIAIPGSSGHNEKNGNGEVEMYAKLFGESGVAVSGPPNLLPVPVSLAQWEVDHEEEVGLSGESAVAISASSNLSPVPVSLAQGELGHEAEVGLPLGEGSTVEEE